MFRLTRLLTFAYLVLLNLCHASSAFTDLMHLLKTVEETRLNCVQSISKSGIYTFKSDPRSTMTRCELILQVAPETIAFVRPAERTCEELQTTSSANISAICDRPHQEEQFRVGEHHFRFDASESVTISVHISPIIRVGCNEYQKNLFNLIGSTVVFENTESEPLCMLQLPPAVEIHYLDFESSSRRRCCPDIFVASSDIEENAVDFSDAVPACELHTKRFSTVSRCEATYLYLRNAAVEDRIIFRVQARHKDFMDECLPSEERDEPVAYVCRNKKKTRSHSKKTL